MSELRHDCTDIFKLLEIVSRNLQSSGLRKRQLAEQNLEEAENQSSEDNSNTPKEGICLLHDSVEILKSQILLITDSLEEPSLSSAQPKSKHLLVEEVIKPVFKMFI